MDRRRGERLALAPVAFALALGLLPVPSHAQEPDPTPVRVDEFGEPEEPQSLREQLTEREDEIFVEEPWRTDLFGRALTLSGEGELALDFARRAGLGRDADGSRVLRLGAELDVELFYPLADDAFAFVQGVAGWDRLAHAPQDALQVERAWLERGETWIVLRHLGGRALHLEVGSLDFEDDRTFWWDEDLDAVRLEWEGDDVDLALAFARELLPRRTDEDGIDPEQERVGRVLAEATWEWREHQALELFVLRQGDRSSTERPGTVVAAEREDESDADLLWIGPRAVGAWEVPSAGIVGYWIDAAWVGGHDTALAFEEVSARHSRVEARTRRRVRAWAVDVGATWALPLRRRPRLTLAFASATGDDGPESGTDTAFRQSGIEGNEVAFGGVERFARYGVLLDPELSNLRVWTLGLGIALGTSSSLDLVLHDYRLREPAGGLRDARLELETDGRHGHLGQGVDLVLALEEWARFQATFGASAFRAGRGVDGASDRWVWGGFVSLRAGF